MTALLYLNHPTWEPTLGGEFRLWYDDESTGEEKIVDIAPKGGRMIVFFSDSLVHAVMPTGIRTSDGRCLFVWCNVDATSTFVTVGQYLMAWITFGLVLIYLCSICLFSFNITRPRRSTDHRYALTVWLPTAKGVGDIEEDRVKEEKHWGDGSTLANEENEEDVVKIW